MEKFEHDIYMNYRASINAESFDIYDQLMMCIMGLTPRIVTDTERASLLSETAEFKHLIGNLGEFGKIIRGLTNGIQMGANDFCYQSSFGVDAIEKILSSNKIEHYFIELYGGNETDANSDIKKFEKLSDYFSKNQATMCNHCKISFFE